MKKIALLTAVAAMALSGSAFAAASKHPAKPMAHHRAMPVKATHAMPGHKSSEAAVDQLNQQQLDQAKAK